MTAPEEVVEGSHADSSPLPRLFGDGADGAGVGVGGAGGSDEGVGEADDRVAGVSTTHAGAEAGSELAELIARARALQAARGSRRRIVDMRKPHFAAEQRLLILDTWLRSKLPAGDFAPLVGISKHTLLAWKSRFEEQGPGGLDDKPMGRPTGSRLPEATKRSILMLKEQHADWGQDRISAVLQRTVGFQASPAAVGRVLEEAGYVAPPPPAAHAHEPVRFERARPNQLWQTDLFTFVLKREGRRVHLVGYLDDHSRFVVGYGLHATASGALVREVLEAAITSFGAPEEVLTDNGTQYTTWRGKSEFTRLLERRGIRQVVARPRHPETLGKIERFWGTLWRECVEVAVFRSLDEARRRFGLFIDHYNFQRPHSGIDGLVPADRFFAAAPQVAATLKQRVAANAAELAREGAPRKSFYLTGRIGEQSISLHAEGEKVILTQGDGRREEVDLGATGKRSQDEASELPAPLAPEGRPVDHPGVMTDEDLPPGASALDSLPGVGAKEAP